MKKSVALLTGSLIGGTVVGVLAYKIHKKIIEATLDDIFSQPEDESDWNPYHDKDVEDID